LYQPDPQLPSLLSSLFLFSLPLLSSLFLFSLPLLSSLVTIVLVLNPVAISEETYMIDLCTLIAENSTSDINVLSELYRWTLGSIFAGISSIAFALAWLGRFLLFRIFNEDVDASGTPKGVLPRMHNVAVAQLGSVNAQIAELVESVKTATSPSPETKALFKSIDDRLDALVDADKNHTVAIREIKDLVSVLQQTIVRHIQ
jgi:hypothetical protein